MKSTGTVKKPTSSPVILKARKRVGIRLLPVTEK